MTEIEISKALALAIGWPEDAAVIFYDHTQVRIYKSPYDPERCVWRVFDYRDWNVIGPIAEKLDMFPKKYADGKWRVPFTPYVDADTPQKAIALVVIGAKA